MAGKYIINRSNFTLRTRHQRTNKGNVSERDYMTTTQKGSWEGDVFSYSEGNFKMTRRIARNSSRKHMYGEWLKSPCTEIDTDKWTIDCITLKEDTPENKIVLKPDNSTLLDFAYYGSLTEMTKNAVKKIAKSFPGELYVSDRVSTMWRNNETGTDEYAGSRFSEDITNFIYRDNDGNIVRKDLSDTYPLGDGNSIVEILNPFRVDIFSDVLTEKQRSEVSLIRYFCESVDKYSQISSVGNKGVINRWEILEKSDCPRNARIYAVVRINGMIVYVYYYNGIPVYLTSSANSGIHIRPNSEYVDGFYNSLDDFERLLINRYSYPIYTCNVYRTVDTENGIGRYVTKLTWPTDDGGYNIDIIGFAYESYIDKLLDICEYLDENGYSNNLWKNMVHPSIKNMDRTFKNGMNDDDYDDYSEGSSTMEIMAHAMSYVFDDIKRNAANIGRTNTITYDENGNLPDYFLTDTLSLSGWEVYSAVNGLVSKDITIDNKKYNISDANTSFMRFLKLNSRDILSHKGTREGIEMLLGMFGLTSFDYAKSVYDCLPSKLRKGNRPFDATPDFMNKYDYRIDEYVYIASGGETGDIDSTLNVETYNTLKDSYDQYQNEYGDVVDTLAGLPCAMVYTQTSKYIIPWFDNYGDIDGRPYFQMYGGWGKIADKKVSGKPFNDGDTTITENYIYDETVKYLKVAKSVGDIMHIDTSNIQDGEIVYVNDTSDFFEYYPESDYNEYSEEASALTLSGYFYLVDKEYVDMYGFMQDGEITYFGWIPIPKENLKDRSDEYDRLSSEGYTEDEIRDMMGPDYYYTDEIGSAVPKILYLESLLDEMRGNDPHVGYGSYDGGESYIDIYRSLFKYNIDNNTFSDGAYDCYDGNILEGISKSGFDMSEQIDNMKCWYFGDIDQNDGSSMVFKKEGSEITFDKIPEVGGGKHAFDTNISPYNFEGGDKSDEAAANSVVNVKKLVITFDGYAYKRYRDKFRNYFHKSISPYLKQMIPSSTLYEVRFVFKPSLHGDVNYDGKVDINDMIALISEMSGKEMYPNSDVNNDGSVDVNDVVRLTDILSGKLYGDVNGDGRVDINDLIRILEEIRNDRGDFYADVNGDGVIDVNDIISFMKTMAGY